MRLDFRDLLGKEENETKARPEWGERVAGSRRSMQDKRVSTQRQNTQKFSAITNKQKKCKKWTYNFMSCEIESPLPDFYLLVDNEELCHLRQRWVIKATGRREIRPVWLESGRPWFSGKALYIWASSSETHKLCELQCVSDSRSKSHPLQTLVKGKDTPLNQQPERESQPRQNSWARKTGGEPPRAIAAEWGL